MTVICSVLQHHLMKSQYLWPKLKVSVAAGTSTGGIAALC